MKTPISFLPLLLLLLFIACEPEEEVINEPVIPCLPASLSDHLLAFYPFSNGSINDFSGNEHHLTNFTSARPIDDRNGNPTCAYVFYNRQNSPEFLTFQDPSFLDGFGAFSVSLWYEPLDVTRPGGIFETLVSRDTGIACPDRNGQWSVGLYDCRRAVFGRTNSAWDQLVTNPIDVDCDQEIKARTDTWHHLVASYDPVGVEMKIYRNGILQDSSQGDATCLGNLMTVEDVGDLFIGIDYTGKIDDLVLFDKTLSQQDVDALANMGSCCTME